MINESKTALIKIMNKQKRSKMKGETLKLEVLDEDLSNVTLAPKDDIRLLGINVVNGEEKNLLPQLRKQLGILKHFAPEMNPASRKTLAEGTIISRILYA